MRNILMYGDKAVVLVRNPYKVIVSYWRHMTYGIHSDTRGADAPKYWPMPPRDNNKMFKPEDLQSEQFHQFVYAIIDDWARSILGKAMDEINYLRLHLCPSLVIMHLCSKTSF